MRRLLPGRIELAVFAVLAMIAAAIVGHIGVPDLGLSALSVPLFIAAAVMGMRRNEQLKQQFQESLTPVTTNDEDPLG